MANTDMLNRLIVRNLAVFSSAEISFGSGFNVLTGETGAGKSLLIDALGLITGARANFSLIRPGSSEAQITAEFHAVNNATRLLLESHDIAVGDDGLIIHRSINSENRSRAWINGIPVTNGFLSNLTDSLIEIHGQHEHLTLADPKHQRDLLDAAAGALSQAETVSLTAKDLKEALRKREESEANLSDRRLRLDTLKFQLAEFDQLKPQDEEYEALRKEFEFLHNRERIQLALTSAINLLDEGDTSGLDLLQRAAQTLKPHEAVEREALELIEQAASLTSEAVNLLRHRADMDFDPKHLDWINTRIAEYQALSRKHDCSPKDLAIRWQDCHREIERLSSAVDQVSSLSQLVEERTEAYRKESNKLTELRQLAVAPIVQQVTNVLRKLGMPDAQFQIRLQPVQEESFLASGKEQVQFLVSTNPDLPPGPIGQTASGGELSRIALAIEVLASPSVGAEVMVFDEVDAGVSGRIAEMVGQNLKAVAIDRQVLCVTHLPQVAALAEVHFHVGKQINVEGETHTEVTRLDSESRVESIASMLSGVKTSDSAVEHARSLLNHS